MLELTDTHSLRYTEVAYSVPSFRVNIVIPATLVLPASVYRDLKSSFARMTFPCEADFHQPTQGTNQSRELSVSHPDQRLNEVILFCSPQRWHL